MASTSIESVSFRNDRLTQNQANVQHNHAEEVVLRVTLKAKGAVYDTPSLATTNVGARTNASQALKIQERQETSDEEILASLLFRQMFERRSNIETPHTNTCQWIIKDEVYKQWKSGNNGILWIKGKPGAGKSTLMKFIHTLSKKEHLRSTKINLDFFFNAKGVGLQRTFCGMMRSLLYQLFEKDSSTRSLIKASFNQKQATAPEVEWQLQELKNLVMDVLASSAHQQIITIFIDALDEAEREEFPDISEYLIEIDRRMRKEEAKAKICISCRHYPSTDLMSGSRIDMGQCNAADIATYINDTLALESMGSSEYDAWQKLKDDLVARASGVFQWARLVVPMAKTKIGEGESPDEVREWIRKVPTELSEIYRHILSKEIALDKRPASFALLQWTTLAMWPLSLTELRFAMAAQKLAGGDVRNKCEEVVGFVNNNDRMKRLVTTLSGGLVETQHQDEWTAYQRLRQHDSESHYLFMIGGFNDYEVVEPIHQSVAEFLKSNGLALSADLSTKVKSQDVARGPLDAQVVVQQSHALLFKACLYYLITEDLHVKQDDYSGRLLRKRLPFIAYAARNIFEHAQSSGSHYFPAVVPLISDLQRILPQWIKIYEMFNSFSNRVFHKGATLLHVSSATNLKEILQMQLEDGVDVDSADEAGNTALYYAALWDCEDSVKILLDANATADSRNHNGKYGNALQAAAYNGSEKVVSVLLEKGATVNAKGGQYGNALQAAAYNGSEKVVSMLLEKGADVNAQGGQYGNTLQAAASKGSEKVVSILLNKGADVNIQGGQYGNALQAAAYNGSEKVVSMLLEKGADVNAPGGQYGRGQGLVPLLYAVRYRPIRKDVVRLLIQKGADASAADRDGWTPLHEAVTKDLAMAKVLHEAGGDISARSNRGSTLLHEAARANKPGIVEWLITLGLDVNALDSLKETPLHKAAVNGHHDVVMILLSSGAQVNIQGLLGQTPLHLALYDCRRFSVIQVLRSHGADMHCPDGYGKSSLDWIKSDRKLLESLESLPAESSVADLAAQTCCLRRSIHVLTTRLIQNSAKNAHPCYYYLGHCLMFLNQEAEALTAFEQRIDPSLHASQIAHDVFCNKCRQWPILGTRHVCKSCPNMDLCDKCMSEYDRDSSLMTCSEHDFLTVPGPGWTGHNAGCVNALDETSMSWLRRIQETYGDREASGC